jgi:hypothetical protein
MAGTPIEEIEPDFVSLAKMIEERKIAQLAALLEKK